MLEVNPISQAIRNIPLPLTKWAQIKLSAFPDEVIEHCTEVLKRNKTKLNNPYLWFFKHCNEYCKRNNIEPDWRKMNFLAESYSMPDNAPMLLQQRGEITKHLSCSYPTSAHRGRQKILHSS